MESQGQRSDEQEREMQFSFSTVKDIFVAEDSKICMDVIESQLEQLGIRTKCELFFAGDQILNAAIKHYKDYPEDAQPIKLMLLDNQMPRMLGFEVVRNLRSFINEQNQVRKVKIKEPTFAIVSAFLNVHLKNFLKS